MPTGVREPIEVADNDADGVIAACDGDAREAVRLLLIERKHLCEHAATLRTKVSIGFIRAGAPARCGEATERKR